jgi:hypothetical protein
MPNTVIWNYIKQQRLIEALYFGLTKGTDAPNADLCLALGLICAGMIKPIAAYGRKNRVLAEERAAQRAASGVLPDTSFKFMERLFEDAAAIRSLGLPPVEEPVTTDTFYIAEDTRLVYQALQYFVEARRLDPAIQFPTDCEQTIQSVHEDLIDYLNNVDFHKFSKAGLPTTLKSIAITTIILIERVQGPVFPRNLSNWELMGEIADELVQRIEDSAEKFAPE